MMHLSHIDILFQQLRLHQILTERQMCEMESLEAKLKWTYQPMKSQCENINER